MLDFWGRNTQGKSDTKRLMHEFKYEVKNGVKNSRKVGGKSLYLEAVISFLSHRGLQQAERPALQELLESCRKREESFAGPHLRKPTGIITTCEYETIYVNQALQCVKMTFKEWD